METRANGHSQRLLLTRMVAANNQYPAHQMLFPKPVRKVVLTRYEKRVHWFAPRVQMYLVREVENTTNPRPRELLREDEVERLILDGVTVRIVETYPPVLGQIIDIKG